MKKFLADGMLRGLLRWLRFLGFDTLEFQPPAEENIRPDAYVDRYFLTNSPGHFQNWKADKKILIPYEKVCQQLNYFNNRLDIFAQVKFYRDAVYAMIRWLKQEKKTSQMGSLKCSKKF